MAEAPGSLDVSGPDPLSPPADSPVKPRLLERWSGTLSTIVSFVCYMGLEPPAGASREGDEATESDRAGSPPPPSFDGLIIAARDSFRKEVEVWERRPQLGFALSSTLNVDHVFDRVWSLVTVVIPPGFTPPGSEGQGGEGGGEQTLVGGGQTLIAAGHFDGALTVWKGCEPWSLVFLVPAHKGCVARMLESREPATGRPRLVTG
jgi:hypothetical protein